MQVLQKFYSQRKIATFAVHQSQFTKAQIAEHFGFLLPVKNDNGYHVFVSYRWVANSSISSSYKFSLFNNDSSHADNADSDYTAAFVNSLSNYVVGSKGENIQVFYDMFSLKEGEQFDTAFMLAMVNTYVVVPFVTTEALKRMCENGSVDVIDHVLLEWWLALTLFNNNIGKVKAIFPVFCGQVRLWGSWCDHSVC